MKHWSQTESSFFNINIIEKDLDILPLVLTLEMFETFDPVPMYESLNFVSKQNHSEILWKRWLHAIRAIIMT